MNDCEVIKLIKKKIKEANGSRRLTVADGLEVDRALKEKCLIEFCKQADYCNKLNNSLSDLLPPYRLDMVGHASAMSKSQLPTKGDWIPQLPSKLYEI